MAAETGPKLQEAIHQMERLSSYYGVARERLEAAKEPRFRPLSAVGFEGDEREYGTEPGGYVTPAVTLPGSALPRIAPTVPNDVVAPAVVAEAEAGTRLAALPDAVTPDAPAWSPTRTTPGQTMVSTDGGPGLPLTPPGQTGMGPLLAASREVARSSLAGGRQSSAARFVAQGPRIPTGTVVGAGLGGSGHSPAALPSQPGSATGRSAPIQADRASGSGRTAHIPGSPGIVPPISAVPSAAERRASSSRPAYLSEDEETWTVGHRNVVPPVID